ncbi:MAG: helix-turn-helix transcriptional regulator [Microvirga sp.]
MTNARKPVGAHLREWRNRRRMSQLDLSLDAEISTRHLSFVETGRSRPSRGMVLTLAERLAIPLRDRNAILVAAGFAPVFPERSLDDAALVAARRAVDQVLKGHEPYPALAIDRRWTLVSANDAVAPLLAGVDRALLEGPVNVLRLSLHPGGLAPRILNFGEWRGHLLARLRHQVDATADAGLLGLLEELRAYPVPRGVGGRLPDTPDHAGIVVPLRLRTDDGDLSLISTTTVFGTAVEVTLSELAIEAFYPADPETAEALRRMAAPP